MTSTVTYNGELRTTCVHLKSNREIVTDAPTDNHGKGEAFSPTDLVATALAACMLSIMGIKANSLAIDLKGTKAEVTKIMASKPRKIAEIKVDIYFNGNQYTDKEKELLKRAALNCPVAKSLASELTQTVSFNF